MITAKQAERVHALLVTEFGGATGLRDQGGLEACLARPYQTFGGEDLYPTPAGKAAAILESIIIRHPWVDGNKRTGYLLMELVLLENGMALSATEDEKYEMTIQVATGQLDANGVRKWLESRVAPVKR
ncbi:MAG: type II toxin-antitoxin system death-on-curing family toxin [Flavobacteriales bacterium]